MNVSLEVGAGSSSSFPCQQLEPGKYHQVPCLGTVRQPSGVCYNCIGEDDLLETSLHYQVDFGISSGYTALARSRNALGGTK